MKAFLFRLFRNNEIAVHELNYLFWECTTRCNLHCRHCGSDCSVQSREKDMPLEDFLGAVDTIPKKEIPRDFTVVLTGGEPLLRPDIGEVGRALRSRGLHWGIVSNGYFYTEATQEKLLSAGLGALTISLDGLEESHDWMRGKKGSFQRASSAIRIASSSSRINSDVVTCVNHRNIDELEGIHSYLLSLGVKAWRLFTIIPIGRAASDPDMSLSPDEMRRMMEFIKRKRKENDPRMTTSFSCEGYLGKELDTEVRNYGHFCRAGVNIASVLIDGTICACPNVDRVAFSQGSIYKDNFHDVWCNKFQSMRDHSWAKVGPCKECRSWKDCLGGGMHNWHADLGGPLVCHMDILSRASGGAQ